MPASSKTPRPSVRLPRLEQAGETILRTWVQMIRTFYRMQRRLEAVADEVNLSLAQFDVLATLGTGEGITQQELAERLLVTKGNVCGLLDRMEKLGLVERRPDEIDRRANRIYLTTLARQKLAAAMPRHHAELQRMAQPLTLEEFKTLRSLLERLDEGLDRR